MILIRQILCPVDFSDSSRRGLEHAVALTQVFNARLAVQHVYTVPAIDGVPLPKGSGVRDEDTVRIELQEFVQPVAAGLPVELIATQADDVGGAILAKAVARQADLLVIGSHGRGRFERLLLGSTTEKVVRKATSPVLVVPAGAAAPEDDRFRRIVCGIDFSEASLHAFRYAVHVAAAAGARVTLVHAIEMPPELRERQLVAASDVDAIRSAAESAALQRLQALGPGGDAAHVRISATVLEGRAHRQILKVAADQHADLVVLGTHGRGTVDRWVFGSSTHAVLRDSSCPVLTVRP